MDLPAPSRSDIRSKVSHWSSGPLLLLFYPWWTWSSPTCMYVLRPSHFQTHTVTSYPFVPVGKVSDIHPFPRRRRIYPTPSVRNPLCQCTFPHRFPPQGVGRTFSRVVKQILSTKSPFFLLNSPSFISYKTLTRTYSSAHGIPRKDTPSSTLTDPLSTPRELTKPPKDVCPTLRCTSVPVSLLVVGRVDVRLRNKSPDHPTAVRDSFPTRTSDRCHPFPS